MRFTGSKTITNAESKFTVSTRNIQSKGFMSSEYERLTRKPNSSQYDKYTYGDLMKILEVMASVKPVEGMDGYSAKQTLLAGKDNLDFLGAHKIFGTFSRSSLMAGKATGNYARFARNCPMGLYAYKEHYGIQYMQWQLTEGDIPYLSILLGPGLARKRHSCQGTNNSNKLDVIDYRFNDYIVPIFEEVDRELLNNLRQNAYTRKVRAREVYSINYTAKALTLETEITDILNASNSTVVDMILQGHTCNEIHRVKDSHILHPSNWDLVPRSYDGEDDGDSLFRKTD